MDTRLVSLSSPSKCISLGRLLEPVSLSSSPRPVTLSSMLRQTLSLCFRLFYPEPCNSPFSNLHCVWSFLVQIAGFQVADPACLVLMGLWHLVPLVLSVALTLVRLPAKQLQPDSFSLHWLFTSCVPCFAVYLWVIATLSLIIVVSIDEKSTNRQFAINTLKLRGL